MHSLTCVNVLYKDICDIKVFNHTMSRVALFEVSLFITFLSSIISGHLGSLEDNHNLDEQQNNDEPPTSPMARSIVENKQLITEMSKCRE